MPADLDQVADELYALPRDEFTAARNAAVKRARQQDDKELAEQIGALRRPSTAAWLVNLLSREHPDEVTALVELGDGLRAAQDQLEGEALRRLSQQRHSYALLRDAMARTNRAGVATFVMRGKEYLTAVRADDDVLALETLFFADEIRDRSSLDELPGTSKAKGKEMEMATGLIESMSGPWRPEDFRDTFTERVEKVIEDKRRGREIVSEAEPPEPTAMSDLIAALEASVAEARGGRKPAGTKPGNAGKKTRKAEPKAPDLSELSKADLTAMARDLDVAGRSSMNRADLEKAVAKASGAAQAKRRKAS